MDLSPEPRETARVGAPVATRSTEPLAEDVERLLRQLPEWFGIEDSVREYVDDALRMPTYVVRDEGRRVIGILLVHRHFPAAAEVHLMAVDRAWHRHGVGRALLSAAEDDLAGDGVAFLQVKTLSASRDDPNYARTREFYVAQGFVPLEEFPLLWNEANPCLQLVKSLR